MLIISLKKFLILILFFEQSRFVHAPLKNQKREVVTAPPPSNIPYLNGVFDRDTDTKPQEIWFKESDSDFVRLSKLGGRHGLK